jgi:hypothetical protein
LIPGHNGLVGTEYVSLFSPLSKIIEMVLNRQAIFNDEGILNKRFIFKLFNFVIFLGALTMSGLGMYGSGEAIKEAFKVSSATSFGEFGYLI